MLRMALERIEQASRFAGSFTSCGTADLEDMYHTIVHALDVVYGAQLLLPPDQEAHYLAALGYLERLEVELYARLDRQVVITNVY